MATNVLLPQWGMNMEDGLLVKWLVKEGDSVEAGQPLVEIETAKINSELESPAAGIVAHITAQEGATVDVGVIVAVIGEPGESVPRPSQSKPERRSRVRRAPGGFNRRRIPRDVLHQMAIHRPRNQRLMQTVGQTALGKLGKGPRKRRLARKPAGTAPAAQPAEPAVNLKTLDQAARRRNVEHGLCYEGARQRRAVLLRPPYLAAEVGQKSLDPHQFQNRDEQLVALAHRAKLALKPREELLLKGVPVIR